MFLRGLPKPAPISVYAAVETLGSDEAYFLLKTNLTGRVEQTMHMNKSDKKRPAKFDKEREFWIRVPKEYVDMIVERYRPDLDLFGYSVDDYMRRLGLE